MMSAEPFVLALKLWSRQLSVSEIGAAVGYAD
jgi:hypothetical protein